MQVAESVAGLILDSMLVLQGVTGANIRPDPVVLHSRSDALNKSELPNPPGPSSSAATIQWSSVCLLSLIICSYKQTKFF